MRTATTIEASGGQHGAEQADFVVEAEKLGLGLLGRLRVWRDAGVTTVRPATLGRAVELVREVDGAS